MHYTNEKKVLRVSSENDGSQIDENAKESRKIRVSVISSLCSGAMAGAMAKTSIAPLDRTKIYFQVHPHKNYRIKGAYKFLKLTYNQTGFLSLWRGNSATMARVIPYAAIQFMSYEQFKRVFALHEKGAEVPALLNILAGSLAGTTAQSVTYPLDRARAVMAVTPINEYNNLLGVFRKIVRDEGLLSLYRGFTPTILGIIPYAGTSCFVYETLKRKIQAGNDGENFGIFQKLLSGAVAGLLGQASSYPLDIVRRRMQTARQMGIQMEKYATVLGALIHILKTEGFIHGWYKGMSMNFIKGPVATGVSFTVYEYCKLFTSKVFENQKWL